MDAGRVLLLILLGMSVFNFANSILIANAVAYLDERLDRIEAADR